MNDMIDADIDEEEEVDGTLIHQSYILILHFSLAMGQDRVHIPSFGHAYPINHQIEDWMKAMSG
jgi:hypothetical protein